MSEIGAAPSRSEGTSGLPLGLRLALPALLVAISILRVLRPVSDPDTFWHIATGAFLRRTWQFNGPDPWSRQSTQPWRLHEWLPELGFDAAYRLGGLAAVAWLLCLAAAVLIVVLIFALRREASLLFSMFVGAATFSAMSSSFSLRPHLVTFVFCLLTTVAYLRTADDGRVRWWLIPMGWVWACSHGMWFVGPVIGVVAIGAMLLDRSVSARHAAKLAAIPFGSVLVAALTPVGPGLLLSPFGIRGFAKYVQEWQPPTIHMVAFDVFLALVALTLVIWARRGGPTPWLHIAFVAMAVGFALLYARTIPVGAVIVAPIAAATLQQASTLPREPITRREVAITCGTAAVALLVAALLAPARAGQTKVAAADLDPQLAALPRGTVVCNDYGIGGWLIWAHPNLRPAIDGRADVYSLRYFGSYMGFLNGEPGWESFPGRVGCYYALLEASSSLAHNLVRHEGWSVLGKGKNFTLLRKP